jgi:hypothetical protein
VLAIIWRLSDWVGFAEKTGWGDMLMRKSIAVFLLAAVAAISPQSASAQPITVPTGLNTGDQYRLAFETSTTTAATSSDINSYNSFVNNLANAPGSPIAGLSTWTAIASTANADARDNTSTNPLIDPTGVRIYTLNNSLIAATNTSLWSGSLLAPLDITETGGTVPSFVWTGTKADGTAYTYADFPFNTSSLGAQFSEIGSSQNTVAAWIAYSNGGATSAFPVYAISGVLTVVPEPSSIILAGLAAGGLAASSIRRRRIWQTIGTCRPRPPLTQRSRRLT